LFSVRKLSNEYFSRRIWLKNFYTNASVRQLRHDVRQVLIHLFSFRRPGPWRRCGAIRYALRNVMKQFNLHSTVGAYPIPSEELTKDSTAVKQLRAALVAAI